MEVFTLKKNDLYVKLIDNGEELYELTPNRLEATQVRGRGTVEVISRIIDATFFLSF